MIRKADLEINKLSDKFLIEDLERVNEINALKESLIDEQAQLTG
jgi:hypothetical protein